MTQVLDRDGRAFGRFNVVDLAAIALVVVLIPLGYVAWRVFRTPAPVIETVTPSVLDGDTPLRVELHGQHFRPYLSAFLTKSNLPFSVQEGGVDNFRATFLIETPTVVDLQLPDALEPGTYDIYLFDEGKQVAHRASAVTLTSGVGRYNVRAGDRLPDAATVDFVVRFEFDSAIAPLVKPGATEVNRPDRGAPAKTPATLTSVRKIAERPPASPGASPTTVVEAVVHAGVTMDHGVWVYPDGQRIRAGESFWFGTADYIVSGPITRIVDLHRMDQ